jgi:hypothetical protein
LHEYNFGYDDHEARNLSQAADAVHLYESGLTPDQPAIVVPASGNIFRSPHRLRFTPPTVHRFAIA